MSVSNGGWMGVIFKDTALKKMVTLIDGD